MADQQAEKIELAENEVLFNEGDWGGTLYQILKGEVEVFRKDRYDHDIVLNTMSAGEIIGLTSFLTSSSRLASVRAKSPVTLKRIDSKKLELLKTTTPKWMDTIIKDMLLRLEQMNNNYLSFFAQPEDQKVKKEIPYILAATQITSIGKYLEDTKFVYVDKEALISVDDFIENIMDVYCLRPELIHKLMDVLNRSGMLTPLCSLEHTDEELLAVGQILELKPLNNLLRLFVNSETKQKKFKFMANVIVRFLERLISKKGSPEPVDMTKSITPDNLHEYFNGELDDEVYHKVVKTLTMHGILKTKEINEKKYIEYSEIQLAKYIKYYFFIVEVIGLDIQDSRLKTDSDPRQKVS